MEKIVLMVDGHYVFAPTEEQWDGLIYNCKLLLRKQVALLICLLKIDFLLSTILASSIESMTSCSMIELLNCYQTNCTPNILRYTNISFITLVLTQCLILQEFSLMTHRIQFGKSSRKMKKFDSKVKWTGRRNGDIIKTSFLILITKTSGL